MGFHAGTIDVAATSERLLMQTYGITLPSPRGFAPAGAIDYVAQKILQLYQPLMLKSRQPIQVIGDGNCLFRALSLHLYGVQHHHFTALEMAEHCDFYDKTAPDFKDLVNEVKITVPPYSELMEDVCRQGIHLYAASAVINVPFKSYFPPTSNIYQVFRTVLCVVEV